MKGVNQLAIRARHVVLPESVQTGTVVVRSGVIESVAKDVGDLLPGVEIHRGEYLIPGMIDLHINGSGGGDAAEGTMEALDKISRSLAAHGTTSFLPTLITNDAERLTRALDSLADLLGEPHSGAVPLGIHLEGPFINPLKKGAHPAEWIRRPSRELFDRFLEASRGRLKMITLAPELEGGLDLVRAARERLPIVSLGHSDADYETALKALAVGANLATHVFNAMSPLHHREPGLVGAILDSGVPAEIIADGIHVHPAVVRLLVRSRGPERVVLVTDAIAAADRPDGAYPVGGVEVTVRGGVCRDSDGRLAGSTLTLDAALRNLREWLGAADGMEPGPLVSMATALPARLLGLKEKGRIATGCDADLVLLDEGWRVQKTWVRGRLVYGAEG